MLPHASLLTVIAFVLPAAQAAVTVKAVCASAEWTFYNGKSPCEIWGDLQAKCGNDVVVEKLDALINTNAHYSPPSAATPCQCNVVAYNLMAACSLCQPNVADQSWPTEAAWKANCDSYDSSGELPSEASSLKSEIPLWVNLKVSSASGSWNPANAQVALDLTKRATDPFDDTFTSTDPFDDPFSTSDPFDDPFTTTDPFDNPFSTSDPFATDDPFDPFDNSFNNAVDTAARTAGIVAGVICGVWALIWITALVIFFVRQKNRKQWYQATAHYYQNGGQWMQEVAVLQAGGPGNPFHTPSPSVPAGGYTPNATPPPPQAPYGDPGYAQGYHVQQQPYAATQY